MPMSDLRFETHRAALAEIGRLAALDQLMTRGDRRRLVREARDWYLETRSSNATRNGTCVVVTAGPPGAGKTSTLRSAVEDLSARLVIDADVAKEFLARWCLSAGMYGDGTLVAVDARPPRAVGPESYYDTENAAR